MAPNPGLAMPPLRCVATAVACRSSSQPGSSPASAPASTSRRTRCERRRTLRDGQYRSTLCDGQDWGELVDLQQDTLELRNLWNDTAARPLRGVLAKQLAREMLAAADTCPYPAVAA